MRVLQYYLAGWHIKPKGVKKPYNPILGEFFRCRYDYPDGTKGFYVAEQGTWRSPVICPTAPERVHSLASPARLGIFLHIAGEPSQHPRRAAAKVQVPWEQRLDYNGGREPCVPPRESRRRRCVPLSPL
jgi:hypothetical protein